MKNFAKNLDFYKNLKRPIHRMWAEKFYGLMISTHTKMTSSLTKALAFHAKMKNDMIFDTISTKLYCEGVQEQRVPVCEGPLPLPPQYAAVYFLLYVCTVCTWNFSVRTQNLSLDSLLSMIYDTHMRSCCEWVRNQWALALGELLMAMARLFPVPGGSSGGFGTRHTY